MPSSFSEIQPASTPVHLYQGTTYNIQRSLINIRLANFGLQLIDIACFGHDNRPLSDFVSFYFV